MDKKMLFSPIASERLKPIDDKCWIKPTDMICKTALKKPEISEQQIPKLCENGDFNKKLMESYDECFLTCSMQKM